MQTIYRLSAVLFGACLCLGVVSCGHGASGNNPQALEGAVKQCRLSTPIDLRGENPLKQYVKLSHAQFNAVPKFTDPSQYDPKTNTLSLTLEMSRSNTDATQANWIQPFIEVDNTLGFLPEDTGTHPQAQVEHQGTLDTYYVKSVWEESGTQQAMLETYVAIDTGKLVGLGFNIPVFTIISHQSNYNIVQYTGEQQGLCLTSGTLGE